MTVRHMHVGHWYDVDESDVIRLAELVQALDAWIANGGFLPTRWAR